MLDCPSFALRIRRALFDWFDVSLFTKIDFRECGDGAHVDPSVTIRDPSSVSLGASAAIYRGCTILSGPGQFSLGPQSHLAGSVYVNALHCSVKIGSGVAIGPFSVLLSYSNAVCAGKTIAESRTSADVVIGDDVFIGAGVVILPGVSIGDGAVIAAGAVINRDIPPRMVVGGVPAHTIANRP